MNTWNTNPKLMERQNVDDIPIIAYLKDGREVEIRAIVVNGFSVKLRLKPYHKDDFQSLYDDVKAGLELYGFKISGRDSVDIDI